MYFVYAAVLKALSVLDPVLHKNNYISGIDEKVDS